MVLELRPCRYLGGIGGNTAVISLPPPAHFQTDWSMRISFRAAIYDRLSILEIEFLKVDKSILGIQL